MDEVRQEAAPSPRAAQAAAHGGCGEGVNQRNARSRRMISCCPPKGPACFLPLSLISLLSGKGLDKVRCSLGPTRSFFSQ